jgi:hypothetical protein
LTLCFRGGISGRGFFGLEVGVGLSEEVEGSAITALSVAEVERWIRYEIDKEVCG